MVCSEEVPQRFNSVGAGALSDTELIALLLNDRDRKLATRLIGEAGSLMRLAEWRPEDFQRLKGIGPSKARQLAAVLEITRRIMKSAAPEAPCLNRPELIAEHMRPLILGLEVEKFWVLCLNRKNRLKKLVEATSGTATSSLAHPREVFRAAIQWSATAVVCVHNHPSGDPGPSAADVQVTRQLRDAAKAVDIELLDHVVVGNKVCDPQGRGYYSFRGAGLL